MDSDEPENFYANIYNYLLKRNNNQNGKNYPKCIYKSNDNDSSEEYDDISDEIHENKTNKNKLTKKEIINAGKYSLYKIPYQCNEYDLIKDIHEKINHRNFDDTRKEFKKLRYYYYGYTIDIKYILNKCSICAQKNKNFARKQLTKPIIFDASKDRYILDLSDMPYFIDINNQKNIYLT